MKETKKMTMTKMTCLATQHNHQSTDLHETEDLIDIAAHGVVVDAGVTKNALGIDDEGAAARKWGHNEE